MRSVTLAALLALALSVAAQFEPDRPCFCHQGEAIEACPCSKQSIDIFNNDVIFDKLQALLKRDFFRFYKVNMDAACPFWPDDRQCASRECGIMTCDDEVPAGLRRPAVVHTVRLLPGGRVDAETRVVGNATPATHAPASADSTASVQECGNQFDPMDRSVSESDGGMLEGMDSWDQSADKFCEYNEESDTDMHYVDLAKNPERYTGYKGDGAVRIWKSIYQENCFKPDMKFDKNFLLNPNNFEGLCLEKRVFYRLISGLHSAITISIAAYNYKPAPGGFGGGTWFRNVDMFQGRFGTKWSWEGPQRLRNVYFTYLLELRALLKAAPYLQKELFYTGNDAEDEATRVAVEELLTLIRQYPDQFDESELFTGVESTARELREEFRSHFHNISTIMDCVGCDKCRLWGKVNTHGMGTALKILFSDLPYSHYRTHQDGTVTAAPFQLTRNEVVALFQSFGRYAGSIKEVAEFRRDMNIPTHREL